MSEIAVEKQTRLESVIETCLNTGIGFFGSLVLGQLVYPLYGWHPPVAANASVTGLFTIWSIARGYAVRRWANAYLKQFAHAIYLFIVRIFK